MSDDPIPEPYQCPICGTNQPDGTLPCLVCPKPTHLMADADAKRTLCGIGRNTDSCLPYVLVRHAKAHVVGRGMTVCDACSRAL